MKTHSKIVLFISTVIILMIDFSLSFAAPNKTCKDDGCNKCSDFENTRTCTECNVGFFQDLVYMIQCKKCPDNCQTCNIRYRSRFTFGLYCQVCETGYYINSKYNL